MAASTKKRSSRRKPGKASEAYYDEVVLKPAARLLAAIFEKRLQRGRDGRSRRTNQPAS